LYRYEQEEDAITLDRYRKALKKNKGLFKTLFLQFAGADEAKRVGRSMVVDQLTFDSYNRSNQVITI